MPLMCGRFTKHKQLYLKADTNYTGRYTVPVIWDKKTKTIVSNESSEIIRMLYTEFDDFIPESLRETNKPDGGLLPESLRAEIDEMNAWVYPMINNGVYRTGFASSQEAYDEAVKGVFEGLDRMEAILGKGEGPVRHFLTVLLYDLMTDACVVAVHLRPTLDRSRHSSLHDNHPFRRWILHHVQVQSEDDSTRLSEFA